MKKVEEALEIFNNGFNCTQAVLAVFAEEFGMEKSTSLKIATGLGAGLGNQGNICGAVFGAYLALSLRYGSSMPRDEYSKELTYHLTRVFDKEFIQIHGALECQKLLKTDLSTPEGYNYALEHGLFDTVCQDFVRNAVTIAEKLLEKKTKADNLVKAS
jgi:C_GCAxxG_C_C family probable redox protein